MDNKKKKGRLLKWVAGIILLIVAGSFLYISDYYYAEDIAFDYINKPGENVSVDIESDMISFVPNEINAGVIFYPGGKVQFEAYSPICEKLAENGVLCVLLHMPGNLAVFDMNAADKVIDKWPEVNDWYIVGHSLGGAIGSTYIAGRTDMYKGLILLAAYSTRDLSSSGLKVLSIYGSNDGVLNMGRYKKYSSKLPSDTSFCVIEGGCHAYFGSYGAQRGDGEPDISSEEQVNKTVEEVLNLIYKE